MPSVYCNLYSCIVILVIVDFHLMSIMIICDMLVLHCKFCMENSICKILQKELRLEDSKQKIPQRGFLLEDSS